MQEGIGRGGYRILAIVFLVVGLLGIAAFAVAYTRNSAAAFALGCGLVGAALIVLFAIALRGVSGRTASSNAPAPGPAGAPRPVRDLNVEYLDAEADAESEPEPPARRARGAVPAPPNRNLTQDTKGWPSRKGPTGVTRGEARKGPVEFASVEAVAVPRASLRAPSEPPTVLAREVARNAKTPEGMAKGACGTCNAILLAPKVRPLKLRCPACQKVTLVA
ncbi:MAG: hypothetical protein AABX89_03525 [Candidatus Thermoplasmatota archaeon]